MLWQYYLTYIDIVTAVQQWTAFKEYAVVFKYIKFCSYKNVITAAYIRCNYNNKPYLLKNLKHLYYISRLEDYSFNLITRQKNIKWIIEIRNSTHNYKITCSESHSSLKKITVIEDIIK